jgi:hypothetical protein
MRVVAVAIVVVTWFGVAEARTEVSFGDLVASPDGRAWVLVHDDGVTLRRVSPDGAMTVEAVPTTVPLRRIAGGPDGSLWALTSESVLRRTPAGEWRTIATLPEYDRDLTQLVPVAADAAVVLRDRGDGTDAWHVDSHGTATSTIGAELGMAVPDGRGGMWAIVRSRRRDAGGMTHTIAGGYAHLTDHWEVWTYDDHEPIDGVTAMHHADVEPKLVAADGRGGAVAVVGDEVVTIDPAGQVAKRGWTISDDYVRASSPMAVAATNDGAVVVTGEYASSMDQSVDPSPVVRWFRGHGEADAKRLSTTAAWRAAHNTGLPTPSISIAADTSWIVADDIIFVRAHDRWQRIDANPTPPTKFRRLYGLPIQFGYASRRGAANGGSFGVRPEMIYETDRNYRRYGVGGYVEGIATGSPREELVGAGVTVAGFGSTFTGSLSVGGDARFADGVHPQLVVSGFVGIGGYDLFETKPFSTPFGFRVDVRPGTAEIPASVTASLAIDTIGIFLIGEYAAALFSVRPN